MHRTLKYTLIMLLGFGAASCAHIELHPNNKPVRLIFYNEINLAKNLPECTYISPIVSSAGNWYNYLFVSNTALVQSAIDDMYNKANEIDADVVYVNKNIDFSTSVTLLGQAYRCAE